MSKPNHLKLAIEIPQAHGGVGGNYKQWSMEGKHALGLELPECVMLRSVLGWNLVSTEAPRSHCGNQVFLKERTALTC